VIVLRTYAHDTITEMAANSRVPVINALSDFEHPCQALADFMTLEEHFGSARPQLHLCGRRQQRVPLADADRRAAGRQCTVATPRGYSPDIEIVTKAREMARSQRLRACAAAGSAGRRRRRGRGLHRCVRQHGLRARIDQARADLRPFQVNEALMRKRASHAVFMHCLPARRNAEVTDAVLDGPQSIVFDQAENRMHAQKALLLLLLGGWRIGPGSAGLANSASH
jgi:ornithine carbamoyltransferase